MILCITGPSSIGKTALSIELAQKYNAIIINADATQVYSELNIGSAKIRDEEKKGIKHYLLDIKTPMEDYSVSDFQKDARKILDDNKNRNIIVVGGTGLYLKALFYDYQFTEMQNNNYDAYSNEELYKMAKEKDENVQIHPNNRVRLINFLNKETSHKKEAKLLYNDVIFIGLTMDRKSLYERLDKRTQKMLDLGLEKEAKALYQKYPESRILKRAIGYKELISYFDGHITYDEAVALIKKNTRHYAKRQYTWFNNQMNLNWFEVNLLDFNKTTQEIISFIESLNSK